MEEIVAITKLPLFFYFIIHCVLFVKHFRVEREREGEMEEIVAITKLPEECISLVISLTTPGDSCRSALVSTTFRSAADSDAVWERFLPSDYQDILSRAVDPIEAARKKDLYFRLCNSILIDGGKIMFSLERSRGAKSFTLSARHLLIGWSEDRRYWKWISRPNSRFPVAAKLLNVCWLEIRGEIDCRVLSPKTSYAAYLICKIGRDSYGLDTPLQDASIKVGSEICKRTVCLDPPEPHLRDDGWMEIELGEFFNDVGEDGKVDMRLLGSEGLQWKRGLIVEGIEVRPKN